MIPNKKPAPLRVLIKVLKISGISIGILLLLMFLLPYLFPGFVSDKIRGWARHSFRTEMNFSSARLSFFRHFPALTLTLNDFRMKGSAPFEKESLVEADEVSLGVDLRSIFTEVTIDKIFLTNAFINIQVDTAGHANYNVYAPAAAKPANPADTGSASLRIQKIIIDKSRLIYNDRSLPILINAKGVQYEGSGDLSKAIFDLHTHMGIDSMDLYYNHLAYFLSKKINADLITKINTNSLALFFEKNNLRINNLPVVFTGRFEFLKEGYDMDFKLKSTDSDLHDLFTALPPDMLDWLSNTQIKGFGDVDASLTGKYIASTNTMPDLILNMKVRDGYISNAQAPSPVKNLFLNFQSRLPGLNPDSLSANIDSLYFNLDKDYFSAILKIKGMKTPYISANINSEMDLGKWAKATGVKGLGMQGRYDLHFRAEGPFATKVVRTTTLRHTRTDTVIASIPSFSLRSSLRDGYIKYASRPEAVQHISFNLDAACPDNDYKHTRLSIDNINATVLGSYIKGFFHLENASDFPMDASLETVFHLSDLAKVYPMDSLSIAGDLAVHLQTKGRYLPAKKQFPVTTANLQLDNGSIQTKYYPHPLEKIKVDASITSRKGTMKDLSVSLTPVSFVFEGQPFFVRADLSNFDDLRYQIQSKGVLDIGKIYQVFAVKGYDVKGYIETNLSLRGKQSDAAAGRYDQLSNSGTMRVRELTLNSELFPLPFRIREGLFRFDQDKMWFDQFKANYGNTDMALNGWLSGLIDYMSAKHGPLKGSFDLRSDNVAVDQFMAFAPAPSSSNTGAAKGSNTGVNAVASKPGSSVTLNTTPGQAGVIIVPSGLSLTFNAAAKKVRYNGMDIDSFQGQLVIDSGAIHLNKTGFTLIGAPVVMDAMYKSLTPHKAEFDYHITAKDFDVQRAYREIRLFHDLASSASKAQGIISLDYQLSGRLDDNMRPVYPSLKGGGVLAVSKVKVKGLKLFSAVSKESKRDVNDPDLSKVDIKSTINNNIINIERTKMKVSVFKLRMEGQASFDGKLNLRFRVGLPPFGVIGIPLKITGTGENPIVKGGRGNKNDELQETEDKDEEGKEN